jgi:O-antigen ligase
MIAVAAAGIGMALVSPRARWRSVFLIAALGVALIALSGSITSTSVYHSRFANSENVHVRLVLQKVALELAERRPLIGWGYGSFDTVKTTVPTNHPEALANTSHNSFLTVLAELGAVGILLLLLPWFVLYGRAISAARRMSAERWFFVAVAGAVPVYVISASTYDTRFFSYVPALPWILLGLARRLLADEETRSQSTPTFAGR